MSEVRVDPLGRELAPANNLPDWSDCRQRVENSRSEERV